MSVQPPDQRMPGQQKTTAQAPGSGTATATNSFNAVPRTSPPILVYLPGLTHSLANSAPRIAELMAIKASKGPGMYTVEKVSSPSAHLIEGRRIVRAKSGPVLDLYTLDYRPRLQRPASAGSGEAGALRRLVNAVWYFGRTVVLVLHARRRAKSPIAKWQLAIGLVAVAVMLLSVVYAILAGLAALGVWDVSVVPKKAAPAIALVFTWITALLIFKVRPLVVRTTTLVVQLLDYVEDERHAAGVADVLNSALDDILEADPHRKVHLFGYSLGTLVVIDFLYPHNSLHQPLDERHTRAILTLVTVGCPVDFVRLYLPHYTDDRMARVPGLNWKNIYIGADAFGSNFLDGDDLANDLAEAKEAGAEVQEVTIAGEKPASYRYTGERLTFRNIWGRRGFLSHVAYWDEPECENCLHLVMREVMP